MRTDLILHFLAGFFIAMVATTWLPDYSSVIVALGAGLIKELVYDKWINKSIFDYKDLILTTVGGAGALWLRLVENGIKIT